MVNEHFESLSNTIMPSAAGLVPKMPETRKYHRDAMFIRRRDHFLVAHRASGLDHRFRARLRQHIDAVAEREERVG